MDDKVSYSIRDPDSKSFDYRADIYPKATAFMRKQHGKRITLVLTRPRACLRTMLKPQATELGLDKQAKANSAPAWTPPKDGFPHLLLQDVSYFYCKLMANRRSNFFL